MKLFHKRVAEFEKKAVEFQYYIEQKPFLLNYKSDYLDLICERPLGYSKKLKKTFSKLDLTKNQGDVSSDDESSSNESESTFPDGGGITIKQRLEMSRLNQQIRNSVDPQEPMNVEEEVKQDVSMPYESGPLLEKQRTSGEKFERRGMSMPGLKKCDTLAPSREGERNIAMEEEEIGLDQFTQDCGENEEE